MERRQRAAQKTRCAQQQADALRAEKNQISKQIGALMAQGKKEEAEEAKKQAQKKDIFTVVKSSAAFDGETEEEFEFDLASGM